MKLIPIILLLLSLASCTGTYTIQESPGRHRYRNLVYNISKDGQTLKYKYDGSDTHTMTFEDIEQLRDYLFDDIISRD